MNTHGKIPSAIAGVDSGGKIAVRRGEKGWIAHADILDSLAATRNLLPQIFADERGSKMKNYSRKGAALALVGSASGFNLSQTRMHQFFVYTKI
jgi:hypothetical protein